MSLKQHGKIFLQPSLYRPALIVVFLILMTSSAVTGPKETAVSPFTSDQFASIIRRVSEQGGEFWNDNYVSNEAAYLHPLRKMKELGIRGGVYIGVGPNQNFTYIAKTRPRYAFIVDIRKQNSLLHLLCKALFHLAADRSQYLSFLLGRPIVPGVFNGDNYGVDDLVKYFEKTEPDPSFFFDIHERARSFLMQQHDLGLNEEDWTTIEKIHLAFYNRGLSIKYDYIPVPTYGEFLVERDLDGNMQNFLNSSEEFAFIKKMEEENRIIPIVGDFSGPHALKELGRFLKEKDEVVTVFYTSNVEQYLVRNMVWPEFIRNVSELPMDERAVFIRAHWSNYIPHPDEVAGYRFTQILQWAKPFLTKVTPSTTVSYWDIVTTDTIKLR
ncbi:MAG: hypothetical protein GXX84_18020 [Acidobacteria bacterium]|nr:hypothetical protein [Acidobacteriota bacterium]